MKEDYIIVKGVFGDRRSLEWQKIMVEGEIVDTVFAIRKEQIPIDSILDEEEFGWRITHLPTGYLLVSTYFETFEGAKKFANIALKLYGDLLNTTDITVFKDIRTDKEEYHQFYVLKEKMNNIKSAFSMKDLRKL